MPAYFKCLFGAGNAHQFDQDFDIKQMKEHPDYVEIDKAEYDKIRAKFDAPKPKKSQASE